MKILIAGSNGMLAVDIAAVFGKAGCEVSGYGRNKLDITDMAAVKIIIAEESPDFVINCAAFTNVDRAESEPEAAFKINDIGAGNLAGAAFENKIPIIHFSTDYVFDGLKNLPYVETDITNPLNVYGKSKLAGEYSVAAANPSHIIIRTSWLYSVGGSNFVKTIIGLAKERETLEVVDDQVGCPTWTVSLARAVFKILEKLGEKNIGNLWGIYNYCERSYCSRFGFTEKILMQAGLYENFTLKKLIPVNSEKFVSRAKRPKWSVLDCGKISDTFGLKIDKWESSLEKMIKNMPRESF